MHHLKAILMDVMADGAACGQGQNQNFPLLVFKPAHQGLALAALEMGHGHFGDGRKI